MKVRILHTDYATDIKVGEIREARYEHHRRTGYERYFIACPAHPEGLCFYPREIEVLKGDNMSNKNYVVIDGKTINLSEETVRNLKGQLGIKEELEFGDIVTCVYGKRIVLKDGERNFVINRYGEKVGIADDTFYRKTGKNIFKNNSLDLDN